MNTTIILETLVPGNPGHDNPERLREIIAYMFQQVEAADGLTERVDELQDEIDDIGHERRLVEWEIEAVRDAFIAFDDLLEPGFTLTPDEIRERLGKLKASIVELMHQADVYGVLP